MPGHQILGDLARYQFGLRILADQGQPARDQGALLFGGDIDAPKPLLVLKVEGDVATRARESMRMNELAYGVLFIPTSDLLLALKIEFPIPPGLFGRLLLNPLPNLFLGLRIPL